jgi:selenocysteine-specific elongation factor
LPDAQENLSRNARGAVLIAHVGTTRAQARVSRLSDDTAHIVLDRELPCEGGLGIVLRGPAIQREFGRILGGGRVLDAQAPRPPRPRGSSSFRLRVAALRALASGDMAGGLLGLVRCRAPHPVVEEDLERRLGLEPGAGAPLLDSSRRQNLVVRIADTPSWTTPEALEQLLTAALELLHRYHAAAPHDLGAPVETIRSALARLAGRHAASHALELAIASGRIRAVPSGDLCLPEFAAQTARAHDDAADRVRATLDAAGLEGATEQEITRRSGLPLEGVHAALGRLAKAGEARRLSGLWFGEQKLVNLRVAVRSHLLCHPTLSVVVFKELFSVSRKQAIPLLEDLDHQGITKRQGDERVLGPAGRVTAGK